jgi:hypothetical protein
LKRRVQFVLAGLVGNYLLGIIFHCYQSSPEGDQSLYPSDTAVWNGWFASPPFSIPEG